MSEPAYPTRLEGKLLTDLTEEIRGTVGFEIPEPDVKAIFEGREALLGEIREWGFCDSSVVEGLRDVLARQLVGRPWPPVDDSFEAHVFFSDLATAAKQRGWTP